MSGQFVHNNNNTNLIFEWENISPLPETTVERAAHLLFDRGLGNHGTEEDPIVWTDLVEDDYLEIVSDYLKRIVVDLAGQQIHNEDVQAASDAAAARALIEHGLEA